MLKFKKIILYIVLSILLMIGLILLANLMIVKNAQGKTYDKVENIPPHKVGLVLGTAKKLQNGTINLYFKYRIKAVVELYQHHKIDYVLVSGDNGSIHYDEPNDFLEALIKRGIPEDKIYLDFAGFRTLDSVVSAKEVFGQDSIIVISQKFHNERAIYLAEHYDINAIGFNAQDIHGRYGLKVKLREYLARVKVFLDIIFNIQPKFLGKEITIE